MTTNDREFNKLQKKRVDVISEIEEKKKYINENCKAKDYQEGEEMESLGDSGECAKKRKDLDNLKILLSEIDETYLPWKKVRDLDI